MPPRTALITGASSGIGQACAVYLVEHGFRVYGTSRFIRPDESRFTMLQVDVTHDASVQRAIDTITARESGIDDVVNNAGIAVARPLESTSSEQARRLLDVNPLGAFRVTRAVLPVMRSQRNGYIVNIGSIAGVGWKCSPTVSVWSSLSPATPRRPSLRTAR